ncbi:MAG: hypothetical protein JSU77_00015 [Fidelibacterota bacterium]|nr:MAG: hypothetical protein JSU77_00015 [Candidatus Neomarinimicrobiota bacterium]
MALVAMFVALMVGSGWALAMVPNVEFVTALAFTAGATLGPVLGAVTGAGGMFLFSATNPVGSGLAFPVMLAAQVAGQAAIGLLGGLFSRADTSNLIRWPLRLLITIAGLTGTVLYDSLTSISFPLFAGAPPSEIIALLVSGLVFTAIHQVSNTLIFFLLVPQLIQVSRKSGRTAADDFHSSSTYEGMPQNHLSKGPLS